MSVYDEGGEVPAMMSEEPQEASGQLPSAMFRDDAQARAAALRATQPVGAVFAIGWVMAELFDPRRRVSVTPRQPFNPRTQLPLVADLAADPKLVFLAAELSEYLHWFPTLAGPLRLVIAQTNKKKAAIAAENRATAQAADQPDDVLLADAAAAVAAERSFSAQEFFAAVAGLHQAILDEFADNPEQLSAYQLGLALSDLAWLPSLSGPDPRSPAGQPGTLFSLFGRPHLATVQTLLNGSGTQLPSGAAATISRSLDNWASWIDVNSARISASATSGQATEASAVLQALRVQGWVWHSVLIADPEVAVQPAMGAWVEAASSTARAVAKTSGAVLRRFWPLVVLILVVLGCLLGLVFANLSGISRVWASLVTVAAVLGSGSWGLGSGVSSALDGLGYEIWSAAKLDAAAWNITWLPALTTTPGERFEMERRGVAMPQVRQNLDTPAQPAASTGAGTGTSGGTSTGSGTGSTSRRSLFPRRTSGS